MMMNKLPFNTSLSQVLQYLCSSSRWGRRNRALFALRQNLRIKDIATMKVSDILNPDMTISRIYTSSLDWSRFEISDYQREELSEYLFSLLNISELSLNSVDRTQLHEPLFPTAKSAHFTPNTLAQHFCHLDKRIHNYFLETKKGSILMNERDIKLSSSHNVTPFVRPTLKKVLSTLLNVH
jgi:hypothetical protein